MASTQRTARDDIRVVHDEDPEAQRTDPVEPSDATGRDELAALWSPEWAIDDCPMRDQRRRGRAGDGPVAREGPSR